jgi:conjugative relaxase-like TrwC/TraI family protein
VATAKPQADGSAAEPTASTSPDYVRDVSHDCHERAVTDALAHLEREACRAKDGRVQVRGEGFLATAFRHRTSRAGDPLLHTHVIVANRTLGPDGRWTALDAPPHAPRRGRQGEAQSPRKRR